jgi:RND superfamily putative drug exporter
MGTFLYRLGKLAFRRRWLVTLIWVGVLGAVGAAAASAPAPSNGALNVPGTQSQNAFNLVAQRFPGSSFDGATAQVVFQAPHGRQITSPANTAAIEKVVGELKTSSKQVAGVVDPFAAKTVSKDGSIAYAEVTYNATSTSLTTATTNALRKAADDGRKSGLTIEIGGNALTAAASVGSTEVIGLLITAIVLLLTFGSLVAAGLPLFTALIGVGVGVAGITALSSTLNLSSTTSILALMLGLAVGIDYALFIVSRYREELVGGVDREEAAGRAVGTAGSSVVFAGLTVIIALGGLAVVNIPTLTDMGLAAAGTIVVAVLVALTLIPAVLAFARNQALSRKVRKGKTPAPDTARPNVGARWSRFVLAHPVSVLLVGVIGLGAIAVPALSLRMALPDDGHMPKNTTQRRAYDLLSEGFGTGFNGPLLIVVNAAGVSGPQGAAAKIESEISALPDVASVAPAQFNATGNTATIDVIPGSGPNDTATHSLVTAIRADSGRFTSETGAEVLVSGTTALNIDISQRLSDAMVPYLSLVVGLAFLLLMVVFRSVLVPLKAALGFLLSVLASLGALVAVFQWGWFSDLTGVQQTSPIVSTMPIFLVGIVFGLAMDYEVFLVSRIREAHANGTEAREAVVSGFSHSARVVGAGAVIMTSVFLGFMGSTETEIKMLGFALGVAVLFDAFVVRMVIVPATLALLGKAAWWLPAWLDLTLPNVDIEGERLRQQLTDDEAGGSDSRLAHV